MVKINGEQINADKKKLTDFLAEANYSIHRIAVEINGRIIPKSEYAETFLHDGDLVEIVNFVGGG